MDRDSVILKGLAELDAFAAGCMKSAKRVRGLQEGLISHGTLRKPSKEQRLLIHLLTLLGWWGGGESGLSLEDSGLSGWAGSGMKVEVGA